MDWKALGTKVADAAPILGTLLGGPQGAIVGSWIAKKFGTDNNPESILETLNKDAEWAFKLKQLEADQELQILTLQQQITLEEIKSHVTSLQAVNQTMQAESMSEDPWQRRWRPFIGFVFGGAFAVVTAWVCYLMYLALFERNHDAMRSIPDLVDTFTMLFAIPGAILGVSAWGRNQLKLKRGTTTYPGDTQ